MLLRLLIWTKDALFTTRRKYFVLPVTSRFESISSRKTLSCCRASVSSLERNQEFTASSFLLRFPTLVSFWELQMFKVYTILMNVNLRGVLLLLSRHHHLPTSLTYISYITCNVVCFHLQCLLSIYSLHFVSILHVCRRNFFTYDVMPTMKERERQRKTVHIRRLLTFSHKFMYSPTLVFLLFLFKSLQSFSQLISSYANLLLWHFCLTKFSISCRKTGNEPHFSLTMLIINVSLLISAHLLPLFLSSMFLPLVFFVVTSHFKIGIKRKIAVKVSRFKTGQKECSCLERQDSSQDCSLPRHNGGSLLDY